MKGLTFEEIGTFTCGGKATQDMTDRELLLHAYSLVVYPKIFDFGSEKKVWFYNKHGILVHLEYHKAKKNSYPKIKITLNEDQLYNVGGIRRTLTFKVKKDETVIDEKYAHIFDLKLNINDLTVENIKELNAKINAI